MPEPAPRETARSSWLRPSGPWGHVPLGLLVSLIVLTGAAWSLTVYQAVSMSMPMGIAVRGGMAADGMAGMAMGGMTASGWSIEGLVIFVAVWSVMMSAMMLPAAAPMIFLFASAQAKRRKNVAVPTLIFAAGYLLVWAGVGALVYVLVQIASDVVTRFAPTERADWAPLALGTTVVAAGLYQFTPIKRVCLAHCRSPFAFVAQYWREGQVGALTMGFRHGAYCLGCCWALFAIMVAVGVMSLAWMLLLTLVVFAEKVLPQGRRAAAAIGVALAALGIIVAFGATPMPWLAQ